MMRTTAQLIFGTVQTRVNRVDLENMLTFRSNETFDVDTTENGPSKTWDLPPSGQINSSGSLCGVRSFGVLLHAIR